MPRRGATAALLLVPSLFALASQPQFWKIEGARDFLDGEVESLSIDSVGRVRLAPATRLLFDTEAPSIWCLARDPKGALYAGTGNDGKIYRIDAGKGTLFYDAAELEVHALAVGPDGRLYAGTSPDGKVYAIDQSGKADAFYDPTDKYIWALAFDAKGQLLVATGADAKVHRVDKQGKGQVVLTSPETHITALAVDDKGNVLAGSAPGGVVYRIDPASKVAVVHDSSYREVKGLAWSKDGTIYAAVIDGRSEDVTRPPLGGLPSPLPGVPEGFVAETVVVATATPAPAVAPLARASESPRGPARGALLRLSATGEVDTLWSSNEDTPFALERADDGLLLGTGGKGKLYRVNDDRTWTMVTTFSGEQVTALLRGSGVTAVALSNPGRVFALEPGTAPKGSFVSKVKDSDTVSSWGRLRWEAALPAGTEVQIQTRTGNTSSPDTTWSEWSTPYTAREGAAVTSERARFIQLKASLLGKGGATPVLDAVQTAYLQRNLRPVVSAVTVYPPGEVFQRPLAPATGEIEILGLEAGQGEPRPSAQPTPRPAFAPSPFGRRLYQRGIQTFSWRAEDPNGDSLGYDVHYRAATDATWRLLRKGLSDAVLAWDTSTVPNGRYVVRVTASDAPSNPEALALMGDKESDPFEVDNTPPQVQLVLAQRTPPRVRVTVKDDSSLIRRTEWAIDGGRWQEVHPSDGINDALEESYEIAPGELQPGPHVVVVRATDSLGNVASARIELPGPGGR
jgi:WD40 repeat protein